jgi:hypothetical protein
MNFRGRLLIAFCAALAQDFLASHANGAESPQRLHLIRPDGSVVPIVVAQDAAPHTRAAAVELAAPLGCLEFMFL